MAEVREEDSKGLLSGLVSSSLNFFCFLVNVIHVSVLVKNELVVIDSFPRCTVFSYSKKLKTFVLNGIKLK